MSDQGDNSGTGPTSDPVALSSDVGTWAAAFIAIVALVGIIAPYLALQASLSDRNRAMNAVLDQPQKYITNGIRFTKGLRIWRRIRVPNLSPSYITNEPEIRRLIPRRAATARWMLRPRDYLSWNSGWAKLAELIESYEPHDVDSNRLIDLDVDRKNGTLEIVNSRTALVVSKYWILLLGLLGRYGQRKDKGVLQNTGVRRDFEGERGLIRNFFLLEEEEEEEKKKKSIAKSLYGGIGREEFEWIRKKERKAGSNDSFDEDGSWSRSGTDSGDDELVDVLNQFSLEVKRGAYGGWTLERHTKPTIHGITGTMQALGRQKGSWSYLTSISFVPHTTREILPLGDTECGDQSSLETHFWLAHGFLPCAVGHGRRVIIPLEDPLSGTDTTSSSLFKPLESSDTETLFHTFSLRQLEDLPVSIGNAMRCLGIPEPEVLQFLPVEPVYLPAQEHFDNERPGSPTSTHSFVPVERKRERRGRRSRSHNTDTVYIKIQGSYVCFSRPGRRENFALMRKDLERMVSAFLSLDWDPWGYLIWKDGFWAGILTNATSLFRLRSMTAKSLATLLASTTTANAAKWAVGTNFDARKINDYRELEELLSSTLQGTEILPLRLAIGALYILDSSCRSRVENACKRLLKGIDRSTWKPEFEQLTRKLQDFERELQAQEALEKKTKSEKEVFEAKIKNQHFQARIQQEKKTVPVPPPSTQVPNHGPEEYGLAEAENATDSDQPIWTRMSLNHIDLRTLRFFDMQWKTDPDDNSFVLIKRRVPSWEQDMIWEHTARLRSLDKRKISHDEATYSNLTDFERLKQEHRKFEKLREGVLQFDYDSKVLKWYEDSAEKFKFVSWRLKDDLSGMPGSETKVTISEREVVLVGLWAATRALLWLSSQDSKPLLKFIEDLDPHVYVL